MLSRVLPPRYNCLVLVTAPRRNSLSPDPSVLIAPGLARTRFAIVKKPFLICLENEKCEYHMLVS